MPEQLLLHRREGGTILPRFVEESERGLLEDLIARRERAVGRFQSELEPLLVGEGRFAKRMLVAHVLAHMARPESRAAIAPRKVRAELFLAGAGMLAPREAALASVAEKLQTTPAELEACMFADLPGERRVAPLPFTLSAESLRWKVNAALLSAFFARSIRVVVRSDADLTPLVRHARWSGLIAERSAGGLVLSGPFALFRHTGIYARALAGAVGALAAVDGAFSLELELKLKGERGVMALDHTAPVFVEETPPESATASHVGRFARAFERIAPGWAAIADPAAVVSGEDRLDADLLLVPPEGGAGHYVELLKFWNPAHVRKRLAQWNASGASAWLVLDEEHNTADEAPPDDPRVLLYKRKPGAEALHARLSLSSEPRDER